MGFYVDLGCGDPLIDNVTFDLYRRGWRGLVVDGDASVLSGYPLSRPGDTVRHEWLSSKPEIRRWVPSRTVGLSRLSERGKDRSPERDSIEVRTTDLATILSQEDFPPIDLLKIDCEGADLEILRGSALRRFKPRVVIVEEVNSLVRRVSRRRRTLTWFMLVRGYKKCLFDGVNIFFCLRREKELSKRLSYPACVLDMPFHRYQQARAMGWIDGEPETNLPL